MKLAVLFALLVCVAPVVAAGPLGLRPVGRPDGDVRERFDVRGAEAPQTRLLLAAGAAGPLTGPAEGEPADLARAFVLERLAPAGELALLSVAEGGAGVSFVTFEQRFGGVPVALGRVSVAVLPDGSVLAARVGELAPAGPPRKLVSRIDGPRAALAAARRVAGDDSASALRRGRGRRGSATSVPGEPDAATDQATGRAIDPATGLTTGPATGPTTGPTTGPGTDPATDQTTGPATDPTTDHRTDPESEWGVSEVLLATRAGAMPVWRVRLHDVDGTAFAHDVFVAAEDGRVLRREPAVFGAVSHARVVPLDPSRGSVLVEFPDPVTNPSVDSPLGWETTGQTEGNNVRAGLNWGQAFDIDGPLTAATGDPLMLDFPFTGDSAADVDAAVTNVFWALNAAHDRMRARGFTESAGAFQQDSLGRGGTGGDRLHALVQYDSRDGTRPVNYTASGAAPDGGFAWIVVGLFQVPDSGEVRDAAFETDLLYHEYVHAAVTRLVGDDPACLGGVQPAALAEGWSDFLAASFTDDPVIGAWVSDDEQSGLRRAALDGNNFTLLQFCAEGCNATADGEIWAGALWDLREDFIELHGPELGVELVERLVVEGMRYTNCRPTFADARDGLLLADAALFGAQHHCLIWDVMLGRGMGQGTESNGPDDELPTPGFGRPPECTGSASIAFDLPSYGVDAEVVVEVLDGDPGPLPVATVSSPSGGSVELPLSRLGSGLLLRGVLRIREDAPAPGELRVASGEVLTGTYERAPAAASADVSDALSALVERHEIWAAWCQRDADDDHDDTPGWWVLPGFLDAGENADIYVTLASLTESPLIDLEVRVTSLSPNVDVLPAGAIALGTVPAAAAGAPRSFQFDFKAVASPSVLPGELAEIRFDLSSRGRSGSVVLPLTLNMDYVIESALSPFARGLETFEPDSPTRLAWTHRSELGGPDDWRLEGCAGVGRSWGYGNMSVGCEPYTDEQGAPVLLSPPLFDYWPGEIQAFRVNALGWSSHVALGHDRAEPYCDLDLVAVFLTSDPSTLPYDDPTGVWDHGPQRVYSPFEATAGHASSGPYYVNTGPQLVDPAVAYQELRLAWILWNDIYPDYCGDPDAVGTYFVDDIAWSYDVVRAVPEATPCGAQCVARIELRASPPGPKCDGEAFMLDASATEVDGCAGELYYSFSGPGVPPTHGWTRESSAPATGADGASYAVYVQCDTDEECNHYRAFRNASPAAPSVGTTLPGSLRVARSGDDLLLWWLGAAAPPSYGLIAAVSRAELEAGLATWSLRARVDDEEGPRGEGELRLVGGAASGPALEYLAVVGRDRCTDALHVD